jgi:hypothetical protein
MLNHISPPAIIVRPLWRFQLTFSGLLVDGLKNALSARFAAIMATDLVSLAMQL